MTRLRQIDPPLPGPDRRDDPHLHRPDLGGVRFAQAGVARQARQQLRDPYPVGERSHPPRRGIDARGRQARPDLAVRRRRGATDRRARHEGWNLVALDLGVDFSTAAGEAMANMTAVFAQLERRLIGEGGRTAARRPAVAGRDVYPAPSSPPGRLVSGDCTWDGGRRRAPTCASAEAASTRIANSNARPSAYEWSTDTLASVCQLQHEKRQRCSDLAISRVCSGVCPTLAFTSPKPGFDG